MTIFEIKAILIAIILYFGYHLTMILNTLVKKGYFK